MRHYTKISIDGARLANQSSIRRRRAARNSSFKDTSHQGYTGFSLDRSTPSLWRVTFHNPPINLIDPMMIVALHDLLAEIEEDDRVAVVVFDSADADFFLAHYDIAADQSAFNALPAARTPFHHW